MSPRAQVIPGVFKGWVSFMSVIVPLFPERDEKTGERRGGMVAALDVGSMNVACLIGEVLKPGRKGRASLRVTGHALRAARGVKAGVIVDQEAAEESIRLAVDAAERMAGVQVREVWVNLSGGAPRTHGLVAETSVDGQAVGQEHLSMLSAQALARFDAGNRLVVQVSAAGCSLDGGPWIGRAEGLVCDRLRARVNVVSMARGPLRNLEQTLAACQLEPAGMMVAPLAASEAVLTDDERELGALVLDIGAAQTGWAAWQEGMLLETAVVPVGGHHVTQDIAAGLGTPIAEAERLKTRHGTVAPVGVHDEDVLSVPVLGESGPGGWQKVRRAELQAIIRPRVEEMLELLREATAHLPLAVRRHVVLTGGGAQLTGLAGMAEELLGARVRVGGVRNLAGLPPALAGPSQVVVAGLAQSALRPDAQGFSTVWQAEAVLNAAGGYLGKVRQWFRESF